LPAFRNTDKAGITVRQLLTHRSGVWEWQPTWLHRVPSGGALPYLAALPLRYPIGARFAYSDLGFMILGAVVAKVSGIPLDRYVR
ncbi:serine hydrolase, partial [Salmonella enterica]